MVEIEAIGSHTPFGMRIEVSEDKAVEMIKSGNYKYVSGDIISKNNIKEKPTYKKRVVPDESWREKDIKKFIKDNNLDIPYNISNDSKTDVIMRLKSKGHI